MDDLMSLSLSGDVLLQLAIRGGAPMEKLEWIGVGIRPPEN